MTALMVSRDVEFNCHPDEQRNGPVNRPAVCSSSRQKPTKVFVTHCVPLSAEYMRLQTVWSYSTDTTVGGGSVVPPPGSNPSGGVPPKQPSHHLHFLLSTLLVQK